MERYNNILKELRTLFPHSTDIRIEIDTNTEDIKQFSNALKELSKTTFYIKTGRPEPEFYSGYRSPFGYFKLNNNNK